MDSPASDAPSTMELLDHLDLGVTAFDRDFKLRVYNKRFLELLDIPSHVAHAGAPLDELVRFNAERGEYGPGDVDEQVRLSVERAKRLEAYRFERVRPDGTVLDIRGAPLPGGGFVTTYADITQHRRAEREREESTVLLKGLLANLPAAVYLKDTDGRYIMVNPEFERLFDLAPDTAKGATAHDILPAATAAAATKHDREVLDSLTRVEREEVYRGAGQAATHLVIKSPLLDDAGKPLAILCVETDITERKRTEEALRESEARFAQAAHMANLGHWAWDEIEDKCTYCSDDLAEIHGVTVEEYLAALNSVEGDLARIHPDDRERYNQVTRDWRGEGDAYDIEYRIVRPDGEVRNVREMGQAIHDDAGRRTRSTGTKQDITRQKRAERELASKQAQLQVALDNMPGGMMLGDEDLNYALFNRQYIDLYEFPDGLIEVGGSLRDELCYQAARGDFGPGDNDELVEQVVAIYQRAEAVSYERTISGGRTLQVNIAPTPEGGRVTIATDITERKRADDRARAELKRIEEELNSARELQLAMVPQEFPPPSRRRPLAFAAVMEPAREVGGDFYDVIELDDHRVGIVIGDVSGKGAGAALFMARAFTTLNATAERGGTPGAVLSQLNDVMCAGNDSFMFVTVFYGVFDGATGVLTFANAGHNPPLVLRADRSVEELAMTGDFAVGIEPGHGYGERSVELRPGELLFCYTDGIIDAVNAAGDQFSEAGLSGALRACERNTADGLVSHVLDRVSAFTGHTPQFDDITCIAMEHLASGGALAAPGSVS